MQMNRTRYTDVDAGVAAEVRAEIARNRTVTITGLADRLGIRRATLSTRINGQAAFTPSLLAAVAAELGTTASQLIARAERAVPAQREAS